MLFSMSQSLSCVLIHVVFSTKDRAPILDSSIRPALNAYLATVARSAMKDGDMKDGDRQDVPHEPMSEDFLSSAWAPITFFFSPRVA